MSDSFKYTYLLFDSTECLSRFRSIMLITEALFRHYFAIILLILTMVLRILTSCSRCCFTVVI